MKNAPLTIYLQTGLDSEEAKDTDFKECAEVTWCADSINDTDIVYVLEELCNDALKNLNSIINWKTQDINNLTSKLDTARAYKALLRELAVRTHVIFPVTDGDLELFKEGTSSKGYLEFLRKVEEALDI